MLRVASRLLVRLSVIVALFSALSLAWTIPLLGLGATPPPSALLTTDISPQCADVNNGTYLCCGSTVQGGNQAVVALSAAAGYQLPANTVNGLECSKDFNRCDVNQGTDLCCQVITLLPLAGLWCHYM